MHWILVANATHARLLEYPQGGHARQLHALEHPQSRQHTAELGDDRAGWTMSGQHHGGAALSPRTDAQAQEHTRFAQEIAGYLERAAGQGLFSELTVFAAPAFLGELRKAFGRATAGKVQAERAVDLTHVGPAEIGARIEQELASR